jgi:hypothetical protein
MSLTPSLKFEKVWSKDVSLPIDVVNDSRYVYVLTSASVTAYEWWGEESQHEPLWQNYGSLEWQEKKFILKATFPCTGMQWLFLGYNCLWVVGSTTIQRIDLDPEEILKAPTDGWSSGLTMDKTLLSNPCFVNNKLWALCVRDNDKLQYLKIVDLPTKSQTNVEFITRSQNVRADLTQAYNDYVYVTAWNSGAVLKYNATTGSFVSIIPVNANPYKLRVDKSNRRIYVASYGGMISYIDPDTDAVTHVHSSIQSYGDAPTTWKNDGLLLDFDFTSDGKLWYLTLNEDPTSFSNASFPTPDPTEVFDQNFNPAVPESGAATSLGRITMSNNQHVFTTLIDSITKAGSANNASFLLRKAGSETIDSYIGTYTNIPTTELEDKDYFIRRFSTSLDKLTISRSFTYSSWDGSSINSVTVSPYLFLLSSDKLYGIRLVNELCRENYVKVTMHHMVSNGQYDYTGDSI